VKFGGESQVTVSFEGVERLVHTHSGFVVPAGAGVRVGGEAKMKWCEPARADLVRLVQTSLNLVDAGRDADTGCQGLACGGGHNSLAAQASFCSSGVSPAHHEFQSRF
jgi:hypothetical protein